MMMMENGSLNNTKKFPTFMFVYIYLLFLLGKVGLWGFVSSKWISGIFPEFFFNWPKIPFNEFTNVTASTIKKSNETKWTFVPQTGDAWYLLKRQSKEVTRKQKQSSQKLFCHCVTHYITCPNFMCYCSDLMRRYKIWCVCVCSILIYGSMSVLWGVTTSASGR